MSSFSVIYQAYIKRTDYIVPSEKKICLGIYIHPNLVTIFLHSISTFSLPEHSNIISQQTPFDDNYLYSFNDLFSE